MGADNGTKLVESKTSIEVMFTKKIDAVDLPETDLFGKPLTFKIKGILKSKEKLKEIKKKKKDEKSMDKKVSKLGKESI